MAVVLASELGCAGRTGTIGTVTVPAVFRASGTKQFLGDIERQRNGHRFLRDALVHLPEDASGRQRVSAGYG